MFINIWWFFANKNHPWQFLKTTQPKPSCCVSNRRWAMWRFRAAPRKTWRRSRVLQRSPLVEVEAKAVSPRPLHPFHPKNPLAKAPGGSKQKGAFCPAKKRGEGKMGFWMKVVGFDTFFLKNLLYKKWADSERWWYSSPACGYLHWIIQWINTLPHAC